MERPAAILLSHIPQGSDERDPTASRLIPGGHPGSGTAHAALCTLRDSAKTRTNGVSILVRQTLIPPPGEIDGIDHDCVLGPAPGAAAEEQLNFLSGQIYVAVEVVLRQDRLGGMIDASHKLRGDKKWIISDQFTGLHSRTYIL